MDTRAKARALREEIMDVAIDNRQGHIAPSLSCLDILTVLFYKVMDNSDCFVLSKGHGCYGLYAIWADHGVIAKEIWRKFKLPGCLNGYGSLGHGLPVATGMAFASAINQEDCHTFVVVGDGEMQEGSCWEAINFIGHHKLDNITVIVDANGIQAMDYIDMVLTQDLKKRIRAFGLEIKECNGHNHGELIKVLEARPQVVIAHTIKGKGFGIMENKAEWHYRVPERSQL